MKSKFKKIYVICTLICGLVALSAVGLYQLWRSSIIAFGSPSAEIKIVEYLNFQCIDCYEQFQNLKGILDVGIEEGYIYYQIKHVEIGNLENGNFLFLHLSDLDSLDAVESVFDAYSEWKTFETTDELAQLFDMSKNVIPTRILSNYIINLEKHRNRITFVPTTYVNGERYSAVLTEELLQAIIKDIGIVLTPPSETK